MKTYMESAFARFKFPVISAKQSTKCKSCNAHSLSHQVNSCSESYAIL